MEKMKREIASKSENGGSKRKMAIKIRNGEDGNDRKEKNNQNHEWRRSKTEMRIKINNEKDKKEKDNENQQ
jgi:hypothetical protein